MGDNLKEKMVGALKWSTVDRLGQQAVQFAIGMILARLLTPEDFGLMGLVMIFAALSYVLVESGFGQALIRKNDTNELDYNTVFYSNVVIALFLYFILFFLSPLIANFFEQPDLLLICRVMFIAIIFNSFYLVPYAKLGKVLDYKKIAIVNVVSSFASGILGIVIAIVYKNVWALVIQQVAYHFFRMILFYYTVNWKPVKIFSFSVLKAFFPFTVNLLFTSILNVLFNNLFIVILGKFYPKSEVGYYVQGNKLNETVSFTIQSVLLGSTFSMFSQIQNDDERFRRIFRELSNKVSLTTLPFLLALIASASQFVVIIWSDLYIDSVLYFQLLCLAALFIPLYTLNISALNARGLSKITMLIESTKRILILVMILLTFNFGIVYMLIGYIFSSYIAYFMSLLFIRKEIKYYFKYQRSDMLKNIILSLLMFLVVYSANYIDINIYLKFILQIVSGLSFYLIYLRMFYSEFLNKIIQNLKTTIIRI
ncbi:MAG: lipopolysaccharide biosynthesis protein [Paludibacteraceae bacterium]|nr:lipopolysaccharide biosynthesis protein [Paludibacteraceae bacterium]